MNELLTQIRKEQQEKYYHMKNMHVTQRDQYKMNPAEELEVLRMENERLRMLVKHMQDMLHVYASHTPTTTMNHSKRTRHSIYFHHLHKSLHF